MTKTILSKRSAVPIESSTQTTLYSIDLIATVLFFKAELGEIGRNIGIQNGQIKGQTNIVPQGIEIKAVYSP